MTDRDDLAAPLVLAQIQNHLHLPMQMPDGAALAELRRQDPKAHAMWLEQVESQLKHQRFMESAHYRMPLRVMLGAQAMMLGAVVAGFALVAWVAYLELPWLAAMLGALDLVGIVALFTSVVHNRADDGGDGEHRA